MKTLVRPVPGQLVRIVEFAPFGCSPTFTLGECVQVDCCYLVREGPAGNSLFLRNDDTARDDDWVYVRAVGQPMGDGTICRVEAVQLEPPTLPPSFDDAETLEFERRVREIGETAARIERLRAKHGVR